MAWPRATWDVCLCTTSVGLMTLYDTTKSLGGSLTSVVREPFFSPSDITDFLVHFEQYGIYPISSRFSSLVDNINVGYI